MSTERAWSEYARKRRVFVLGAGFSAAAGIPPDFSSVNFSDLCTHIEFVELREFAGGERRSSEGCREKLALRHYLAKQIVKSTPSAAKIPNLYLSFAQQLSDGDIVITFNWDTLLESAIQKVGKSVTYGFSEITSNNVRVYKLHGSTNWRLGKAT